MGEAEIHHLRVPAPIFIFVNGNRLSQVPACRFSNCFQTKQLYGFRNLAELHQNKLTLRART